MDEQGHNDKLWDRITKSIEEEKCILILGPDIVAKEEDSLNEQLKSYLENRGYDGFTYYTDDEFFSFTNKLDKIKVSFGVKEFYEHLEPSEIHRKIAEIPFHLIISLSPDLRMKKIFDKKKCDCLFDFYYKDQNPQGFEKPSISKPLIYNLFGNVEVEESFIFTYDDLFDYLIAIFGKHGLHQDLRQELKSARMILFLGFKFDKWYFKLVLRLLEFHEGKLNYAGIKDRSLLPELNNFYACEFNFEFLNYQSIEIIETIHKKCQEKGSLRTIGKPALSQHEIFISYSWGGESEQIVEKIYGVFSQKGYNVIRDKEDLAYKGNIREMPIDLAHNDSH